MKFLPILYQALQTPFGLVVESTDPDRLRQLLYTERRKASDPSLDAVVIATSRTSPTTELWIIHDAQKD